MKTDQAVLGTIVAVATLVAAAFGIANKYVSAKEFDAYKKDRELLVQTQFELVNNRLERMEKKMDVMLVHDGIRYKD